MYIVRTRNFNSDNFTVTTFGDRSKARKFARAFVLEGAANEACALLYDGTALLAGYENKGGKVKKDKEI